MEGYHKKTNLLPSFGEEPDSSDVDLPHTIGWKGAEKIPESGHAQIAHWRDRSLFSPLLFYLNVHVNRSKKIGWLVVTAFSVLADHSPHGYVSSTSSNKKVFCQQGFLPEKVRLIWSGGGWEFWKKNKRGAILTRC